MNRKKGATFAFEGVYYKPEYSQLLKSYNGSAFYVRKHGVEQEGLYGDNEFIVAGNESQLIVTDYSLGCLLTDVVDTTISGVFENY